MNSRIFKLLLIGVIAVLIGTVAVLLWPGTSPTATPHDAHDEHGGKSQQQWTCPMHPQIVRDHPGQCPICNMDLVLVLSDVAVPVPASESEDAQYGTTYYCPMHPSYRSDKPGNCPICNMTLIRMKDGANDGTTSKVYEHATVTITPDRQQLIGVKTRVVEKKPFAKMIRAVGRVDYDERKLSTVALKSGGWIEELFVKTTGETVEIGAPLLSIFSPELYEAKRNYALAYELSRSTHDGMSLVGETLAGARERLKLLDLSDEQIAALDEHREPDRLTTFVSKTRGVVTRRQATAGLYVEPGRTLYELADLSTVWIQADVYEAELPLIHLENIVSLQLDSLPGETVAGRVDFIYPTLEEATRTARVRIEVENADGRLKPGMYATVSIAADLGEQLVIDNDAVLDTGTRQVVFVDLGHGRFEPREIKVGERAEGMAVVLEGVEAGERVVTSANFLVDSESRLKAALTQHSAAAHQGH